ncbi:MAG: hypothetical protein V2I34_05075 [Bacteroidales bacterium]|jgi:hypothetical protein|nr:hypothetical protein [Bacteroidales bacterium]
MKNDSENIGKYYETLVQNAQAGATYHLKLKNDPVNQVVIPLISSESMGRAAAMFTYRVVEPTGLRGTYEKPIEDIEILKKKE